MTDEPTIRVLTAREARLCGYCEAPRVVVAADREPFRGVVVTTSRYSPEDL